MSFAPNPSDGMSFGQLLDADWKRLCEFSNQPVSKRKFFSSFSPRFAAIALIRLAQCLHRAGWRRLAKVPSFMNFVVFGLEYPAKLPIGPGLVIPHSNGIIIGAGYIGSDVTIYQQVTFGAKLADFDYDPASRPIVNDGALITSGAKILGPVRIGEGAIVGANAVVLKDVPDGATAVGVPAKIINSRQPGDNND